MLPWNLLMDKKRGERLNAECPYCKQPPEPEPEEDAEDNDPPRLNKGGKVRPGNTVARAKKKGKRK